MTTGDGPFRTPVVARTDAPRSIGALRARYGVDWARHERWLVGAPVAAFALAGATHGWRSALCMAAVGFVVGVIAALSRRDDRGRVDLHEEGIAVIDAKGQVREIAFDDIDLVFVSSTGPRLLLTRVTITTHEAERIVLPGSRYIAPVAEVLVRRCCIPLVGTARRALANDETLVFGPFTVTRSALSVGAHPRSWSEIERVAFGRDHVTVYGRRGRSWRQIDLSGVPHAYVLAAVLGELTRVEHVVPNIETLFARRD